MNFLFGLANPPGRTAVMSLHRLGMGLKGKSGASAVRRSRAVKIAVHELGHTLGFEHCRADRCVMVYAETAAGVDYSQSYFCDLCKSRFR